MCTEFLELVRTKYAPQENEKISKIPVPGAFPVFPRRNTEPGAVKTKAPYRCKNCKKVGHTTPTCPLRIKE